MVIWKSLFEDMIGKYIVQKINKSVFANPCEVMQNILLVTEHLKRKIQLLGGDAERETLTVIRTKDGKPCFFNGEDYYRVYLKIENAHSTSLPTSKNIYNAARAFGRFQNMLSDFEGTLFETIPDFHNTPKRVEKFKQAVKKNAAGRNAAAEKEIEKVLSLEKYADVIFLPLKKGEIPVRVTHNDTKINNVLLDDKSGEGVCVIDLDTVMNGSLLYDVGDSLRSGMASTMEDSVDLRNTTVRMNLFENYLVGFLEECKSSLTKSEKELLVLAAPLMIYESAVRFLTDYLEGDTYFKTDDSEHNLRRARNQIKLMEETEKCLPQMEKIIKSLL